MKEHLSIKTRLLELFDVYSGKENAHAINELIGFVYGDEEKNKISLQDAKGREIFRKMKLNIQVAMSTINKVSTFIKIDSFVDNDHQRKYFSIKDPKDDTIASKKRFDRAAWITMAGERFVEHAETLKIKEFQKP